jgi:hypothetical protein
MKTGAELRELGAQHLQGKTLEQLGMKSQKAALASLRKAIIEYLDILEVVGSPIGGRDGELYDEDRITAPVCDFHNSDEWCEISVVPLEIAENRRTPQKNQAIARWKRGEDDSA